MDSLVYTRYQKAVQRVDLSRITCSEEGEDCPPNCKGNLYRLPGEGQSGHRVLLSQIIEPICSRITEKTAPFDEEKNAFLVH